ncbi:hypothetical protein GCM10010449_29860 [Streptomyces rectiviolaceus]|uniref:Uncharacterized protein n=1 Tax=Streptomyces rectiviolaceus TaxID=332591 RepID=A0ABP6MFW0_9ACTN
MQRTADRAAPNAPNRLEGTPSCQALVVGPPHTHAGGVPADAAVFLSDYEDDEIRRRNTRRPATDGQARD